jgi:multimeric flavodoxin WrbA
MKVLALNSSPRGGGQSKTELMMNALVEGMRSAGAEVEIVPLRKRDIKNCVGCFKCWSDETPGVCAQKDDMTNDLYPKFIDSDLVVLSTPLYHFTVNATMKTFIERTLPIAKRDIKQYEGKSYHPLRVDPPAVVVVSVAGFAEESVFDQLSSYVHFLYKNKLIAEIYRPAAETMVFPDFKEKLKSILQATRDAGRELVNTQKVSPETMARIKQPLIDS